MRPNIRQMLGINQRMRETTMNKCVLQFHTEPKT